MADFSIDPYTQVYNKLWELLGANGDFARLVKVRNRINLQDTSPDPLKRNIQDADAPEVAITQAGGPINLWGTSATVLASESYRISVATMDERPNKGLNQLKWAIIQALAASDANLGLAFVLNTTCESVKDSLGDVTENRGTSGWSAVVQIKIDMALPRNVLKGTA